VTAWLNTLKWGPFCQVACGDCRGRLSSQPRLHRGQRAGIGSLCRVCARKLDGPVVEPEVLMDGEHTLERCSEVTEEVLRTVFDQLYTQRVTLEGMILKPNMVLPD